MMTLHAALELLARVHTRDDDVTEFAVVIGAPFPEHCSQREYLDAWEAVRAFVDRSAWQHSRYIDPSLPLDIRHLRARQIVAGAMHLIGPSIEDHCGLDLAKHVASNLLDLFTATGIDIVTDDLRAEAGLPPRGPLGWTKEELAALEARRLDAMLRPPSIIIPEKQD